jgi:hypothetical protein
MLALEFEFDILASLHLFFLWVLRLLSPDLGRDFFFSVGALTLTGKVDARDCDRIINPGIAHATTANTLRAREMPEDARTYSSEVHGAKGPLLDVWRELRSYPLPIWTPCFCGKRCLNRYLANRTEQPTSLKEWIEETRKKRNR